MADFRKIGKEDPEPWKPDEVEYALYDDIDRTKIKGYGDDDDESDEGDSDDTSTSTSTPILKRKRKPRPVVHYDQFLQEDTNFVSEK